VELLTDTDYSQVECEKSSRVEDGCHDLEDFRLEGWPHACGVCVQGKARSRACIVVPPHQSSLAGATSCYPNPLPLWAKEMSTGTRPPPIGDITTFTAQLDGLRVDQDPNDLSNALRAAFNEPELYDRYISSLGKDTERVKALLEVFDKVRPVKCVIP